MSLREDSMTRFPWPPMVSMAVSACLALWLLWQPELLTDLAMPLRVPLVVLGAWSLGAGFTHGMGLSLQTRWARWLLGEPTCWWLLGGFALVVIGRAFLI